MRVPQCLRIVASLALFALTPGCPWWLEEQPDPNPHSNSDPTPPAAIEDKMDLWTQAWRLRGANVYQRRVYPELDGPDFMGPGLVGPPYTQEDFDELAAWGANCVNVSHAGLFAERPPYVLDQAIQSNLDALLDMIADAGMYALISFRTGPGRSEFTFLWEGAETWFDESYLNDSVWEDADAQDGWVAMWRHTAERYRDNPVVAGYGLMVEPNANDRLLDVWDPAEFYATYGGTLYDWNQLYPRIVAAIREVDPDTPILIGAMGYSAVEWLPYLEPVNDDRVVYEIHQYEPHQYTHQTPGSFGRLPLSYPGSFDANWDGAPDDVDRDWLVNMLATADAFAAAHGVPLAVTEFGLMRWEPGAAAFMNDQMELFEERGMNWALWVWDPSWEPHASLNDAFNFRHGPRADNHSDVDSSALIHVIRQHWLRNTVRPGL